ncbi:hypothetical protein R1sor_018888 [Riccia sorocarpa]|uniref:Uncharacterized protein n=1 Tax=Riccia sorocarpa TaxID=122646 RepID=A0ABD3IBJ7_9MARC
MTLVHNDEVCWRFQTHFECHSATVKKCCAIRWHPGLDALVKASMLPNLPATDSRAQNQQKQQSWGTISFGKVFGIRGEVFGVTFVPLQPSRLNTNRFVCLTGSIIFMLFDNLKSAPSSGKSCMRFTLKRLDKYLVTQLISAFRYSLFKTLKSNPSDMKGSRG